MDTLKKLFPLSWSRSKTTSDLVIGIIIYVVIAIVAGAAIAIANLLVGWLPLVGSIVGILLGLLGTLIELYTVAGIVILILCRTKVL